MARGRRLKRPEENGLRKKGSGTRCQEEKRGGKKVSEPFLAPFLLFSPCFLQGSTLVRKRLFKNRLSNEGTKLVVAVFFPIQPIIADIQDQQVCWQNGRFDSSVALPKSLFRKKRAITKIVHLDPVND